MRRHSKGTPTASSRTLSPRTGRITRLSAWTERHRQFLDALKAILLIAILILLQSESVPQSLLIPQTGQTAIMWTLIYVVPLSVRRTHADASAISFVILAGLQLLFGPVMVMANLIAPLLLYSAIVYGNPRRSANYILTGLCMGILAATFNAIAQAYPPLLDPTSTTNGSLSNFNFFQDTIVMLVPIEILLLSSSAMGYWRRARRNQLLLLRERNRALEESQKEEARLATLAERSRIARDMHDLVAHTLSIIIVQADGGRYAGTSNPGVAVTTMHTIRDEARHALTSMNGLLGTLGEDEALKRQKQRTLTTEYSSIDALIHQAQAASGTSVVIERSLHGTPPARLPEELSEALFHTVQEALSNVRKYAGTKVHVDIVEWWTPDSVRLSITDDGQGARAAQDGHRPGYGLIGMKERVTALDGTLQAASLGGNDESTTAADHGFAVTAVIPLASSDSQAQETASSKRSRKSSRKRQSNANLIERISTWTQSHFAEVDLVVASLLAVFLSLNTWYSAGQEGTGPSVVFQIIFDIAFCLPLALRRTRPQLSAAAIAGIFIISLLVGASLPFSAADDTTVIPLDGALFALVALYSVVVYGPLTARRWVYPTALCIIAIAVTNIWRYTEDQHSKMHYTSSQVVAITISMAVVITALVLGVVFFGLWKRARGSDIVLLRSREEALIHQRDRQAALAANLERARISEQIQQEVTQTLGSVLTSAQTWIGTLEDIHRRNPQAPEVSPSASDSHTIIEAFSSIAATGRQALAQMRELLGILRQNETPADASRPQLSPIMAPADRSPSIQGSSTNRS